MNNKFELPTGESNRIWQLLSTKIFLTDNDSVLTIGVHCAPKSITNVKEITLLSDEVGTDKYDLIVSNSVLSSQSLGDPDNIYSYDLHFKSIAQLLNAEAPSIYAMWHPITHNDDAVLNALISTLDSNHIRFPRVEEIISAGTPYLMLNEFVKITTQQVYSFSNKNILGAVENHISNMSDKLLNSVNPIVHTPLGSNNDNKYTVSLNAQAGLLMWSNY